MPPIPRYWHVETHSSGTSFEFIPADPFGPVPTTGLSHLVDGSTGEINGEAVLMSALEWPRFRDFATGKQVVLPHWCAIAFERLEAVFGAARSKRVCIHSNDKLCYGQYHARVEVDESKGKAFCSFHCCQTFKNELRPKQEKARRPYPDWGALSAPLPALLPPGEGGGGPVKGLSEASLYGGGKAPVPAS